MNKKLRDEMMKEREPIIEACTVQKKTITKKGEENILEKGPCERIDGNFCAAYIKPSAKWRIGNCVLATHIIHQEDEKKFVNPIKASKRG